MPTTVAELFDEAGLTLPKQPVGWRQHLPKGEGNGPGVYVVSLSANPIDRDASLLQPPVDLSAIQTWIDTAIRLRFPLSIAGSPPSLEGVVGGLSRYWLPDETILYIGKAGPS